MTRADAWTWLDDKPVRFSNSMKMNGSDFMNVRTAWVLLLLPLLLPVVAPAQGTVEERLKRLEERLQRTELENTRLREELDQKLKGHVGQLPGTPASDVSTREVELLVDRAMARRQDTEEKSWLSKLSKSGDLLQFYGFLRLDAHYNSARPNNDYVLFWVLPEDGIAARDNEDSLVFQARWSRLGLNINAGKLGDADVTGRFEVDFANYQNGTAESRAAPRIRLAYMNLDFGDTWLRFGQDWDVISPLYPSVHLSGLLWNVGNLGDRRPMAVFGYRAGRNSDVEFNVKAGLGLAGAVDNLDLDAGSANRPYLSTDRDGWNSAMPLTQVRVGIKTRDGLAAGLWGHFAEMETDQRFNGDKYYYSHGLGLDVLIPMGSQFSVKGEAWLGRALSDVRGGIGQAINTIKGREIDSYGGWAELGFQATQTLKLVAGGAIDNPINDDLSYVPNVVPALTVDMRSRNLTYYVGAIKDWGSGFRTGVEAMYWSTRWLGSGLGTMIRFNVYTQLNF